MADVTYKTVIKKAIDDFNTIQNKINTNTGLLTPTSDETKSTDDIIAALDTVSEQGFS